MMRYCFSYPVDEGKLMGMESMLNLVDESGC